MIYYIISYFSTLALWLTLVRGFFKRQMTRLKLRRRGSFAGSTLVSLIIAPILEKDRVKTMIGAPIMAAMIGGGLAQLPQEAPLSTWEVSQPVSDILPEPESTPTDEAALTYYLPVQQLVGISQFFHAGHPGIDMRAPLGSDVVAMDSGEVLSVTLGSLGYGRHVLVGHGNQTYSLYAHLGKIVVEVGEKIAAGEKIGEVGMSGWSTGPHLHFEVLLEDAQVNPLTYLSKALTQYQEGLVVAGH